MYKFPFKTDALFTIVPKRDDIPLTAETMLNLAIRIRKVNANLFYIPRWKWTSIGIEIELKRDHIPEPGEYLLDLDWKEKDSSFSDGYKAINHDCTRIFFSKDCDVNPEEYIEIDIVASYKGDMQSALYDPDGIKSDVFDMDNMKEGETNLLFKQSDKEAISGKYEKPENGIPESDLSESVQESLSKADTALQEFTETDPNVPSWAKEDNKPTYTADEVGALPESHDTNPEAHFIIRQSISGLGSIVTNLNVDVFNLSKEVSRHENEISALKAEVGNVSLVLDKINGEVV